MKKKVYAYLHTHWDREWYRNFEEFNLRLIEVMDIVLDELKNNRAPFFYLDGQCAMLLDYLKYREEKKEEIKGLIKQKKLAIGPFYTICDSYLISFMSMVKNLDLGLKISKEYIQKDYIGYLSDIFGVSKSIFQALELKNIDKALFWRGVNPKLINNECNFLYGNIRSTWLTQGYFNDFFHADEPNIEGIKKYLDKISKYAKNNILLPIGADHLGMLKNANKIIQKVNSKLNDYEIILCNPFEYFKHEKFEKAPKTLEFLDNSDTYILPGVYSARIEQKRKNVLIQNKLAKKIELLNYYLKENFQKNLDFCWQELLKNHAHDGIYGCSLDEVHSAIDYRQNRINQTLDGIEARIVRNFKEKNKLQGFEKDKIGLFNLTNKPLKTVILELPYILNNSQILKTKEGFDNELYYDIYKIPVTEDIKPIYAQIVEIEKNEDFSFKTVGIKKPKKQTKTTPKRLENPNISLFLKNDKIFVQNKKTDKTYELFLTDIKDDGDSYNFAPSGERKILPLLNTKIIADGEILSCLELNFKDIKLQANLKNNSEFIDFKAIINNKTKNHKLQIVLKLEKNITKTISQDAIGTIERKIDPKYNIKDYMPALRPVELKTNSYPMQSFVNAQNVNILTKGLHEYEIFENELRICLLRAFSTISNPKNKARSIPAGPDLKTPMGQALGENIAEFAILFGSEKKAYSTLDEYFENYIAFNVNDKNFEKKLDKFAQDEIFIGISNNKKIIYDIKNEKISQI